MPNYEEEEEDKSPLLRDYVSNTSPRNFRDRGNERCPWLMTERNYIAFFLLGLLNNITFVINNAGAGDIVPGNYGLIYLCQSVPGCLITLTAPYWFHLVSYRVRILVSALCVGTNFILVNYGHFVWLRLLGVFVGAIQSGLGEATIVALSQFYRNPKKCLVMWSSGTGLAGPAGYIVQLYVFSYTKGSLGRVIVGECIVTAYLATFFLLLERPWIDEVRQIRSSFSAVRDNKVVVESGSFKKAKEMDGMTFHERLMQVMSLWRYIVPLFLVYWSEYVCQSGAWTTFAFPPTQLQNKDIRNQTYQYLNFLYQWGVLVSRSSGLLISMSLRTLWIMPVLQIGFLTFFAMTSVLHFWLGWSLLIPAFCVGLLGGAVYVNVLTLIDREVPQKYRELSLAACTVAMNVGIFSANVTSMPVQWCLFHANNIPKNAGMHQCPFVKS